MVWNDIDLCIITGELDKQGAYDLIRSLPIKRIPGGVDDPLQVIMMCPNVKGVCLISPMWGYPHIPGGGGGVIAPVPGLGWGPPTTQKKRATPLHPPHRVNKPYPPSGYPKVHPPTLFRMSVHVGELAGRFVRIWQTTLPPTGSEPGVGTPCHLFFARDPPSPPRKKSP